MCARTTFCWAAKWRSAFLDSIRCFELSSSRSNLTKFENVLEWWFETYLAAQIFVRPADARASWWLSSNLLNIGHKTSRMLKSRRKRNTARFFLVLFLMSPHMFGWNRILFWLNADSDRQIVKAKGACEFFELCPPVAFIRRSYHSATHCIFQ